MIVSRHIGKIAAGMAAIALCLCLAAALFSGPLTAALGGAGVEQEYEQALFGSGEPISVNLMIDESDWQELLQNAAQEQYFKCDVEINGTTFYSVGVRPKGNTSLSAIASDPDTDRCSLKLEFDHYIDDQTCFGLDKLILNNNYADATNMKEAIVYDMFAFLGADASLCNYAAVSVNGEYWGVYLALEAVEESFLLRSYGTENGALYKPDSMEMGGGNPDAGGMKEFDTGGMEAFDRTQPGAGPGGNALPSEDTTFPPRSDTGSAPAAPDTDNGSAPTAPDSDTRPDTAGGRGFASGTGGGADLNYTDDALESYSTIWDGAVTGSGDSDHRRVIEAIKNICAGQELEEYLDVDNVLRYMAVHDFVVNLDSLSGNMAHNYYLYEYRGQLNILPWDYNLAFGGMSGGSAVSTVNFPINTPFSMTDFFDALLESESYLAQYHAYLRMLAEEYAVGGGFARTYTRIRSQIDTLVETDPTAFYSYAEYEEAAEMLCTLIARRAESVLAQLDGSIPSTTDGQRADASALLSADDIDLSVMGSMNMGRMNTDGAAQDSSPDLPAAESAATSGEALSEAAESAGTTPFSRVGTQMPGGFTPQNSEGGQANSLLLYALSAAVLAAGLIFALRFRRKSRK